MENDKRLIDANNLCKKIKEISKDAGFYRAIYDAFLKYIECSPSVDAVEVVRCKDCIQFEIKRDYCECRLSLATVNPTDFCSCGQRKTVNLEDVVDLEAQTKANNASMRKVIDFIVE